MVSIRHRQEVRTEHAAQLDDGADVVQLYPENSTLVLVPISSGSSSDLRYYGVN